MRNQFFSRLWQYAPLSWAIIRTPECTLLSKQRYISPVLEIGCGDGFVTQLIFNNQKKSVDVGIDLDAQELRRATKTGMYRVLKCTDIRKNSFKSNSFNTIFANGVLEHIPNLDRAISEIARLLKKNGKLFTTSPTPTYTQLLFYYRLFNFLGFRWLAEWYGKKINYIFAHHNLLVKSEWIQLLKKYKLHITHSSEYNNPPSTALHDLMLPLAVLTKSIKKRTDEMVLFPNIRWIFIKPFAPIIEKMINHHSTMYASILLIAKKSE